MIFFKEFYNKYIVFILFIPFFTPFIPILIYLDGLFLGISLILLGYLYYRFLILAGVDKNIIGFIYGIPTVGSMFAGIYIILKYLYNLLMLNGINN